LSNYTLPAMVIARGQLIGTASLCSAARCAARRTQ
jgi:hypothetical protein